MKTRDKIITASAAIAMVAASFAPFANSAFAATAPTWSGSSSVTIKRIIDDAYGLTTNGFTYTITADTDNPAGATGAPTTQALNFSADGYLILGNKYSTVDLSFANMQFERVGDYEYVVRETASSDSATFPVDSTSYYTVIVSVRNNNDLTGYVASLYIKDSEGNKIANASGADSQMVYEAPAVYTNLQVSATASGNAADPDKCFEYTFNIGGNPNNSYSFVTDSECTNNSIVYNGQSIWLKAGDTATIGVNVSEPTKSEIPIGLNYGFTKVDTTDGYTVSMDGVERTTISKTGVKTTDSTYNTANKTTINEHLDSTVPTTVFRNIAIYILLAIAGITGAYFATKKLNSKKA